MINDVVIVIFSKNRALQLDLCLNGLYKAVIDVEISPIKIIYKVDELHKNSYETLKYEHPFPEWLEETDFQQNVLDALKDKTHILFVTDDTIFCNYFSINQVIGQLNKRDNVLGFSLRLSLSTNYCYPLNTYQAIPYIEETIDDMFMYYWPEAIWDFAYPLELSSSIYRTSDILNIIKYQSFENPNDLENLMWRCAGSFSYFEPMMMCYRESKAFANPLNRIQTVALDNRYNGNDKYLAENMLKKYLDGYRVDYNKFFGIIPNACHMEVEILE